MMSINQIRTKVANTVLGLNPQGTIDSTSTFSSANQDLRSHHSRFIYFSAGFTNEERL